MGVRALGKLVSWLGSTVWPVWIVLTGALGGAIVHLVLVLGGSIHRFSAESRGGSRPGAPFRLGKFIDESCEYLELLEVSQNGSGERHISLR